MEYCLYFKVLIFSLLYILVDAHYIKSTKTVPKLERRYRIPETPKYVTLCSNKELKTYAFLPFECFVRGGDEFYFHIDSDYTSINFKCYKEYESICFKRSGDNVNIITSKNLDNYTNGETKVLYSSLESKLNEMKQYKREDYLTKTSDGNTEVISYNEVANNYIKDVIVKYMGNCFNKSKGNEFYYYTDASYENLNYVCIQHSDDILFINDVFLENKKCRQYARGNKDNTEINACLATIKTYEKINKDDIDMQNSSQITLRKMITVYPDYNRELKIKNIINESKIACFKQGGNEFYYDESNGANVCLKREIQNEHNIEIIESNYLPQCQKSYKGNMEDFSTCLHYLNEWKHIFENNTNNETCWSLEYGYPCCQSDATLPYEPLNKNDFNDNKWYGIENGQWCGLDITKTKGCWSNVYGYPCCQSEDTEPYEPLNKDDPNDNRWYAIENDQWCGLILKSKKN